MPEEKGTSTAIDSRTKDAFYVGYLPTPMGLGRILRRVAFSFLIGTVALGAMFASSQRDPGPASWDIDQTHTLTGTLVTKPYPLVLTDAGQAFLLTGATKQGADAWLAGFAGTRVEVKGNPLRRGDLRMFSLAEEDKPIRAATTSTSPKPAVLARISGEVVSLMGEIVDPKCFGGAMKPGEGKAHKGCAALCLRGGIPPVLASTEADGSLRVTLLIAEDGDRLTGEALERAIELVGEPVNVTGRRERLADIDFLRITAKSVARQ